MNEPHDSPQGQADAAVKNDVKNAQTRAELIDWLKLVGGALFIVVLVTATVSIVFSRQRWYELALVIALSSYFPLTYLSYRHFQGKVHRARVQADFKLLGITTENDRLAQAYNQIYSPRQFTIYVALAVLITLLGFGSFRVPEILTQSVVPEIDPNLGVVFYTFLGAFAFSVFYVYRRYVTLDLQPSVYLYITVRMVTVQVIALVITLFLEKATNADSALIPITAFVIGYVPDTGIRWMISLANRVMKRTRQQEDQQLTLIKGISLWHETRLRESGVDNIQNLAAVDVPDLLMHSRFSAQQLMHWIDQAILQINVFSEQRDELQKHGLFTISALRLFMDKVAQLETVQMPEFETLTPSILEAVYYAAATSPNLYYVTHYWRAVETYRTELVTRSLADTLREQFREAEMASTYLTDVPAERLGQVLDSFGLTLEQAETLFKDAPDSLVGLGWVYIQRKQPGEAVRVLNEVITLNRKHGEAYSSLGWAEFTQGHSAQAIQHFDTALALFDEAPESDSQKATLLKRLKATAFSRKGTTLLHQQQYDQALAAYDQALELNVQSATVYYNRGLVQWKLGEFQKAIGDFSQALKYEPERSNAHMQRGAVFLELGDTTEAIDNFSRAIRCDRSNARAYYLRAKAHYQDGAFERALYDLDTALDVEPENAVYYYWRARARRKLEDFEGAVADCTRALRLDVDLIPAYEMRARLYARQGKLAAAIADFERYLVRDRSKEEKIKKHIAALQKVIQEREQEANGRRSAAKTKQETT